MVPSHPQLRVFTGALHERDKLALAIQAAPPDVTYFTLASESAPHTAVSTGTHNALLALEELPAGAAMGRHHQPLVGNTLFG